MFLHVLRSSQQRALVVAKAFARKKHSYREGVENSGKHNGFYIPTDSFRPHTVQPSSPCLSITRERF